MPSSSFHPVYALFPPSGPGVTSGAAAAATVAAAAAGVAAAGAAPGVIPRMSRQAFSREAASARQRYSTCRHIDDEAGRMLMSTLADEVLRAMSTVSRAMSTKKHKGDGGTRKW